MLRWILQEHDSLSLFKYYTTDEISLQAQISQSGIEHGFWFAVTDTSLRQFFSKANPRFELLTLEQLNDFKKEIQKSHLPMELVQQIRKLIADEGLGTSKFSIRLMCKPKNENPNFDWINSYCEMSGRGSEGILQAIKGCWASLLEKTFLSKVLSADLTLADFQISLLINLQVDGVVDSGEIFSVCPNNLLDHRNLFLKRGSLAYIIERETFAVTHADKNAITKSLDRKEDLQYIDTVKKVGKLFLTIEKNVAKPLKGDWIEDASGKIIFKNWTYFNAAPSSSYFQSYLNTQARHFWLKLPFLENKTQCEPYWFSFIVRNFRPMALELMQSVGLKSQLTPEYEKVFRHFFGILRGQLHLNLGSLHRLVSLLPFKTLAQEIELNLNQWQRWTDKDMRVFWEDLWPETPSTNLRRDKKNKSLFQRTKKTNSKNRESFEGAIEKEIQNLYDFRWDMKNISEVIGELRKIENRLCKIFAPALFNELEYWSYRSYIFNKYSLDGKLSFFVDDEMINFREEGSYFNRFKIRKRQEKWNRLKEDRANYLVSIKKIFQLLQRKINFLGSKFVSLGLLQRSTDIFYLTQEELISFEEGRLTSINLQQLSNQRAQEYITYSQDSKNSEIWFTIGLVGLAQKYPHLMPIDYNLKAAPIVSAVPVAETPESSQTNATAHEINLPTDTQVSVVDDFVLTSQNLNEAAFIKDNDDKQDEIIKIAESKSTEAYSDGIYDSTVAIDNEEFKMH